MSKVRINDLARELEVKSRAILDALTHVGVTEKKTHSSSLEEDEAERVRLHFQRSGKNGAGAARVDTSEPKQKIDWSRVSKPGDVLKAIQQRKDEAAAAAQRPTVPTPVPPQAASRLFRPIQSPPPPRWPARARVPPWACRRPRPAGCGYTAGNRPQRLPSQPPVSQAASGQASASQGAPGQVRPNLGVQPGQRIAPPPPPAPRRIVPQPRQEPRIVVAPPPATPAIAAKPPAGPVVARPPVRGRRGSKASNSRYGQACSPGCRSAPTRSGCPSRSASAPGNSAAGDSVSECS